MPIRRSAHRCCTVTKAHRNWGASSKGFGEFIFVRNGHVTEGSHSNMFFVFGDTVFTHPESRLILSGITRRNVIRMAAEAGIRIREEAVKLTDIKIADEAFITNTSAEVTPVTGIDGIKVGSGLPGPLTKRLMDSFSLAIEKLR
ncbi:MAG: aminotransferase class IV [Bacteroidales bacterium]|nr:aminotransferase class IV [Bacteroidales bacterium]